MKKKTTVIWSIVIAILGVSSFPLMVLGNAFLLPEVYGDTFLGEFKEKVRLLKETPGKRIILIGGSSTPFGIDSSLMESKLVFHDYKVIDFGMYAALGSNVMLDFVRPEIHEKDILVFLPEIHRQTLSMYYDGNLMWQALDGQFSDISYCSKEMKDHLWGDLYSFSQSKFKYNFVTPITLDGVYRKASFEEHGDIRKELLPCNVMAKGYDPTALISFDDSLLDGGFLSYLNDFAKAAYDRNAYLYFAFPPMNRLCVKDEAKVDGFYDMLKERLSFDILGNPHDSIMDYEWFYDTNYHLNRAGSILFTKNMIQNIKLVLNDNSKTDITVPQKPVPKTDEEDKDGDDTDEDFFEYRYADGGYVITKYVKRKKNIILPYRHDGKKVIGFDASVFQNDVFLQEVTIQDNILQLFDDSFIGCSSLEKIHLRNDDPSSLMVGDDFLKGCDAYIYVPSEAYGKYMTSYGFGGRFSDRIRQE